MIRALCPWLRLSWKGLKNIIHPKPWDDPQRPSWAREMWRQAKGGRG